MADLDKIAAALRDNRWTPPHQRTHPSDWAKPLDADWKLKNSRAAVVDALYVAERSFKLDRRDLVQDEMAKAVAIILGDAAGLGLDLAGALEKEADYDGPSLRDVVSSVLVQLDNLAHQIGDEGVFRSCRDQLRAAVAPVATPES